ncbi:class I SAM-dependent methyltransferase [Vagococcus silagei]|uniref:Methyltransferase domain-containing protein n=1 Tax=Vagococcus silagei TaxID=2508885 RepID=A0A4S3B1F9_9ENTE|nr:class I SAM-dependent methyltransferase [Vagococcus silagei]THB60258.1 methyltransferase domain-containing protein [Vagococcus silagei]
MLKSALHFSHQLLTEVVHEGDHVIDATMGNGHDTLFLAELVGIKGQVDAFDIQEQALQNTSERLTSAQANKQVQLHLKSHEFVNTVLQPNQTIQAAVFNLGYLPSGDKNIITQSKSTIRSIEILCEHLAPKGRIIVVLYSGHDGGKLEKQQVLDFVTDLPQELFSVLMYQFINQKNEPPALLCIERKKTS